MKMMSQASAVSAIERGDLSELQHVLEESEWDIGSQPLDSEGQTALHIACANGHLDIVQYLVNGKGCSVKVEDVSGQSPPMLSFINKHWKMVNFLLQIAPDPDSVINELQRMLINYNTSIVMEMIKEALIISCKEGYFGLVIYLTDYDWHITDFKETIQLARCSDNLHIVKKLLTHSKCTVPDDMSKVHIACIQGDVETVKMALESNGSSILGIGDYYSTTPIHYATLEPNVLRLIVQYAGEMLLNVTDRIGNTPLHHGIKYECIESVTILVGAPGCDVNRANLEGETPLITACKHSNSAIVQLLVASEMCDLNTCDKYGDASLHVALGSVSSDQLENVQCLLQSDRCDPNVINQSGNTPLHIICHRGNIPLLEALVANKRCDLNIQDGNGDTALHIGVENVKVVKCLLESGRSRCDIYNEKGLTSFHKAITNGVMPSVEVMMKNGVNIQQTTNDKFKNAPIHIACKYSRLDILKVLLGCKYCDPNQQNTRGDTALHIMCRMRTGSELQFFKMLTSTPGINPTFINHEGIAPFEVVEKDGNTLFHAACAKGNAALVEFLIKKGVDILKSNRDGDAPIHTACKCSQINVLNILLSCKKCDPNQQNTRGDTALHIVCRMRTGSELQFFKLLISTPGINLTKTNHEGIAPNDVVDNDGNTLLHIACAKGNTVIVKVLVENGADVLKPDRHEDAPIHIACRFSKLSTLKVLLRCTNCGPNQQNVVGDTALHIVCRMTTGNELQFLEVLTSTPGINLTLINNEGFAPFEVVEKDGNTLFHVACAEGNAALVEFLIKKGVNILKSNRDGDAPIHTACKYSKMNVLKMLLSCKNCDPNQQNAEGDTALHIVCRMRTGSELQFFKLLISTPGINPTKVNHKGIAPCDIVGNDGNTLLHIACAEGNTAIVEVLVKSGADVLKPDRHGDAPIHIACKFSKLSTLKVLLSCANCDPNQQNIVGDTALHIVCRMRTGNELQFLELLTSTPGINPTLINHEDCTPFEVVERDGNTLFHVACAEGNAALVEFLMKKKVDTLNSNREGNTPIHIACIFSQLSILKVLLRCKNCDPNQQNTRGDTALHIVCRMRTGSELQFFKLLTSTPGINPTKINHEGIAPYDIVGNDGNTFLHIACSEGSTVIVEVLVKSGADVLKPDIHGDAPIHNACTSGRLSILKVLLGCTKCDHNQQNAVGDTALHIVCRMRTGNELQFLEVLTSTPGINTTLINDEGIAPFEVVEKDGNTLFHDACAEGNAALVEFLIKKGVNILKSNRDGDAPIHTK